MEGLEEMGIISAITTKLLAVVVKAAIMWVAFMFVFNIPIDKAGYVMLVAFIAELVGSLVASLLLRGSRGY